MSVNQSYANHVHRPTQTLVATVFALIALVVLVINAWRQPTLINLALVSLTLAVFLLISISRAYIVRLQDRIIRLEMQLRLERLGRGADFGRLAHRQVVALRFASDEELSALVDRALTERLSSDQIKQAVKDWRPDLYRT